MNEMLDLPEYSRVSHVVKLLIAQAPISASTLGFVLADMRIKNPHLYVQYMLEKGIIHFGDQLKLTAGPLVKEANPDWKKHWEGYL